MIIAVASGKGGTGKTTVALALAQSAGEEVVLLDADVEEPNLHLFLRLEGKEVEEVFRFVPEVSQERCNFCGQCREICRFNALSVFPGVILTFPELCHGCYGCLEVCKEGAISEGRRLLGRLKAGRWGKNLLAYGELEVGEAMASPLIKALKKKYLSPDRLNIVDCPPGTACPMLTAVRGADFCLLVTEPTPFGLHDLAQAAQAVESLGVPAGVVLNRAGSPYPELYDFLRQKGLPLLLEIPFSRKVAEGYAQGKGLLESMPELEAEFKKILAEVLGP